MDYLKDLEQKLNKLIKELKDEISSIRTNRPTPKLIENVQVSYSDSSLPIKQLASIGVEPPRDLIVTPWDSGAVQSIAKAIEDAGLGVTSSVQGTVVRVTLPELTSERREELSKLAKNIAEQVRIKMRTLRDEAHKKVNQESDEDEKFRKKEDLQKIVDKFNKEIDNSVSAKLEELSQ